jgi:methyltransferase (TIGR00027 family)
MRLLHQSERPSSTAQWTTLGRALELQHPEPIVVDRFAPLFLSRSSRVVQRGLLGARPVFRRAEQLEIAGLATSGLCRHRFIDEHLLAALPDVEQVLILGAGYDSRAYRFASQIMPRPVFEVDLPPLSRRKAGIVAANRARFGSPRIRRVEIDFRTESLAERLAVTGFAAGAPTCVIWEGVSMYLTHDAVAATLAALAALCAPRSVIAMDFWQQVPGPGGMLRVAVERAMRLLGEPITFPQPAASVGRLLDGAGFQLIDLAEADVMTTRYATGGRVCDPGMYVIAACVPTGP